MEHLFLNMSCIFYSAVTVYERIIYRNEQKHRINYLELSHRQRKKFWNSFLITKVYEEGKIIWKRGLRNLFFIYGFWVFFISHIWDIGVAVLFIFRSVVWIFILEMIRVVEHWQLSILDLKLVCVLHYLPGVYFSLGSQMI